MKSILLLWQRKKNKNLLLPLSVPRSGPRNLRVYDPTTSTLTVNWDHADGPVVQYRITYAPTTGDPIEEYVSMCRTPPDSTFVGSKTGCYPFIQRLP